MPGKEIILTPEDEREFLDAFPEKQKEKDESLLTKMDDGSTDIIKTNQKIINEIDKNTLKRLKNYPGEMTVKDEMLIKSEALKHINAEKGITDDTLGLRLIPTTINIQINN